MSERTGMMMAGPRPPLGVLVFDNGSTYTLDTDYLIGRNPAADKRVQAGSLRAIAVDDYSGAVSRVHVEIRLDNWDVTVRDAGSSNGTFVAAPGKDWVQLTGEQPVRLTPETQVRLGDTVFVFETSLGKG
jgi:pSer/pThr/pTyr-binding forkhead associated (FHA) protein